MSVIRTRSAPSPTGDVHLGVTRTALYCWLFANHYEGEFILRIEDTDQARSTPEATQVIFETFEWLGLDYAKPVYFQSQRGELYKNTVEKLLKTGHAYPCYCSSERLQKLRETQIAHQQKPRYDGYCRYHHTSPAAASAPYVIRFKNPKEGTVVVEDKVCGQVQFCNAELDDFILVRSDGTPTYNFTVVVDDDDLAITHVIRGNDHLNNTPRQINVLKALGAPIPVYMHLPMLHSAQGKKLSKREGATSVIDYRKAGFLPDAVINYIARLGWSHGDQEIFSRKELIQYFDGNHLSRSPAIVNQNKLLWLNQYYLKNIDPNDVTEALKPFMQEWQLDLYPAPCLSDIVLAQRDRVKTIKEMAEKSRFFYETPHCEYQITADELRRAIQAVYTNLSALSTWESSAIYQVLVQAMDRYQLKPHQLFKPLRILLTGATISPPMDTTIQLLGKQRVLSRLSSAVT